MLRGILFNNEACFDFSGDNNLMDTLTKNTIVLCEDNQIKNFLANAIIEICEGKHKKSGYDYCAEPEDKLELQVGISYLPTTELFVDNEQKIVLTMEAPYILTAQSASDIWFAQRTKDAKISLYPMRIFQGYEEKWNEGVEAVYKYIIAGRYGDYTYGKIVDEEIGCSHRKEIEK